MKETLQVEMRRKEGSNNMNRSDTEQNKISCYRVGDIPIPFALAASTGPF